jgi:hypothetical protein
VLLSFSSLGASAAERLWNSEIQRDLLPDKPKSDTSAPKRTDPAVTAPDPGRKMRFDFDLPGAQPVLILPGTPTERGKGDKDDRKEQEKRDMKRNWIFVDPEKAAQAASGAEDEEEAEPSPEEALLPYKGVMQQFLEGGSSSAENSSREGGGEARSEASAREARSLDFSDEDDLSLSVSTGSGGRSDSASGNTTTGFNSSAFGGTSSAPPPPPFGTAFGTATSANTSSTSGADERQLRSQQFQQLLRGSAFAPQSPAAAPGSAFGSSSATGSLREYGFGSSRSGVGSPGAFSSSPSGTGALLVPGAGRSIAPPVFGGSPVSPVRPASPAYSTLPTYTPAPAASRPPPVMAPAILPGPGGQRRY